MLTLIFLSFSVVCLDHISNVLPSHLLNCSSSCPSIVFTFVVLFLVPSFHFQFFQSHPCALGNMATFHVVGYSDLTIIVDNLRMIYVFEQCLCTMFSFQLGSLHISKDILYESNNLVSSCCIGFLPCPFKGVNEWLALAIIALSTIVWLITFKTPFHAKNHISVVKIVKNKHKVMDIIPLASFV